MSFVFVLLALSACGRPGPHAPEVPAAPVVAPPAEEAPVADPTAPVTLEELASRGVFEVTFHGEPEIAFPSEVPCLWWEWDLGTRDEAGALAEWRTQYARKADLTARTPDGTLTVPTRKLRPHLAPLRDDTFTAADAPDYAQEWLQDHPSATSLQFCIAPDTTYHARVATERYRLPPSGPDAEPTEQRALVLQVSDAPFEGDPERPITPSYRSFRY